ncbi:hypothetical protein ILUMI_27234 [Ignelater luminosus]|uniref:Uncharacterized protein n=1 Tax=Ignelater luminosus TaxID=2038154 RepID=A0A8K0C392_IGNLU|nr:hypothetical protein ILUMI_27234 [Ignelater luminosus]
MELARKSNVFSDLTNKESDGKISIPSQPTRDQYVTENKDITLEHQEPRKENDIKADFQNLIEECRLIEEMFNKENTFETSIEMFTSFANRSNRIENSEVESISEKEIRNPEMPNFEQSNEILEVEEGSSNDSTNKTNNTKRKKRRFSDPNEWKYNAIKKEENMD